MGRWYNLKQKLRFILVCKFREKRVKIIAQFSVNKVSAQIFQPVEIPLLPYECSLNHLLRNQALDTYLH